MWTAIESRLRAEMRSREAHAGAAPEDAAEKGNGLGSHELSGKRRSLDKPATAQPASGARAGHRKAAP